MRLQRATDWHHWFYLHRNDDPRPLKSHVAERLGVSPAEFSKLLDPKRYRPAVTDHVVELTADMWNQSPDYVRKQYPRAA